MKRLENKFFYAVMKASAFIAAAVFAFSACKPEEQKAEPKVEVSESTLTAEAQGESFELTVTSNVAWTAEIENQDKWVTVDPSAGEAGEAKVTIVVKRNNGDNARDTKVTFKGETASAEVVVNQFGKDNISIDKNSYEATPAGGSDVVKVTTNNNWTATVSEEGAGWVTVAPAEGQAGEAEATVTVVENTAAEPRSATVTFAAGDAKMQYTVSQEGVSVVLAQTSYSPEAEGGSTKVMVTANAAWTATSSAEWVTVAPATGNSGETEVSITVAENAAEEVRSAVVTFTANENVKVEYAVSQAAKKPVVLNNQYAYTAAGAEVIPVDIQSKFATFLDGNAYVVLAPETGINDMAAAVESNEYVVWSVSEAALAEILGSGSSVIDLTTVPAGTAQATLIKNDAPVFEFTGVAGSITSGTIAFNVSSSEVVIDAEIVFPDNSEFMANATFASEAFVKPTGSVAISVPAVTATKAELVFTPDPVEGFTYYWDVLPKNEADILMPTDQDKIAYLISDVEEVLEYYGMTWAEYIDEGVVEYTYTGLSPLTQYYAVAFGVDANGNVTTGLFKTEFATKDIDPALKSWIGTWNLTTTDTYSMVKGEEEGFTGKSSNRTIIIGTDSVFGLELDESDLVVAGLSYTDGYPLYSHSATGETLPMETIATINKNGELELKNECAVMEYSGLGVITWYGHAILQGNMYYISGEYAPYTLALGTDKTTATGTPEQIETNIGDATIAYYDVRFDDATGSGSIYSMADYGALSGTWTLTKVPETPTAAPQSVEKKIVTKLDRKKAVQINNLIKNLNSSYLFTTAK